jgi:glyoxylase-like metal-dependent hydrolase (beta-lactamase superfamily II)
MTIVAQPLPQMPYVIEPEAPIYGEALIVSPLIRRIVARNPSPMTYTGSGTYIIGHGTVAVIDPGPNINAHVQAILAATQGETISHIVVTHTHRDHSPAAVPLKAASGAQVVGCNSLVIQDDGPRSDEAFDSSYAPDVVLSDGMSITGPDWTLTAVHTPGHTSNHTCYALEQEQALFTGDHVMGWSTTVVSPPDGDMADYLASLRKLLDRSEQRYYPTHGKPIENPHRFVRALLAHRKLREAQVLNHLKTGAASIADIVAVLYATTAKILHGAAGRSVLAHVEDLIRQGLVKKSGGDTYELTQMVQE